MLNSVGEFERFSIVHLSWDGSIFWDSRNFTGVFNIILSYLFSRLNRPQLILLKTDPNHTFFTKLFFVLPIMCFLIATMTGIQEMATPVIIQILHPSSLFRNTSFTCNTYQLWIPPTFLFPNHSVQLCNSLQSVLTILNKFVAINRKLPLFYSSSCSGHSAKLNPQHRKMHSVIEHQTIFGQEHLLLNLQLIGSQPFLEYRDTVSITGYTQILSLPGSFGLWEKNWNRVCLLIGKCSEISLTDLDSNFISNLEWLPVLSKACLMTTR